MKTPYLWGHKFLPQGFSWFISIILAIGIPIVLAEKLENWFLLFFNLHWGIFWSSFSCFALFWRIPVSFTYRICPDVICLCFNISKVLSWLRCCSITVVTPAAEFCFAFRCQFRQVGSQKIKTFFYHVHRWIIA